MYGPRLCKEFMDGVEAFIKNAKKYMVDNGIQYLYCPCKNCKNEKRYLQEHVLKSHLIKRGFMEDYRCWNKHDEGLNEVESRDSYVEREVHSVVEEEDDDVDEADILGLSNADIMEQVVLTNARMEPSGPSPTPMRDGPWVPRVAHSPVSAIIFPILRGSGRKTLVPKRENKKKLPPVGGPGPPGSTRRVPRTD
jgi:hypothetical protein